MEICEQKPEIEQFVSPPERIPFQEKSLKFYVIILKNPSHKLLAITCHNEPIKSIQLNIEACQSLSHLSS